MKHQQRTPQMAEMGELVWTIQPGQQQLLQAIQATTLVGAEVRAPAEHKEPAEPEEAEMEETSMLWQEVVKPIPEAVEVGLVVLPIPVLAVQEL